MTAEGQLPPGQVWGKKFVIYAALGIPHVDPNSWRLKVDGMVERPLEYTYDQLTSMEQKKYNRLFHCLVPGSMVYANPEPKRIENVKVGDSIIGLDGLSHTVRELVRLHHNGRIVGVKASYLPPVKLTPDHPVLTIRGHPGVGKSKSKRRMKTFASHPVPSWIPAGRLKRGDYVFFPKYRFTSRKRWISYKGTRFIIDRRLASILGWYVAEGSGGDSDERTVAFSLSGAEQEHISRLRKDLSEAFGAKTSVYTNAKGALGRVVVTSSRTKWLARMLKAWCGTDAFSKHIPDFVLNAEPDVLASFLTSYFQGDGYSPFYRGKMTR